MLRRTGQLLHLNQLSHLTFDAFSSSLFKKVLFRTVVRYVLTALLDAAKHINLVLGDFPGGCIVDVFEWRISHWPLGSGSRYACCVSGTSCAWRSVVIHRSCLGRRGFASRGHGCGMVWQRSSVGLPARMVRVEKRSQWQHRACGVCTLAGSEWASRSREAALILCR